MFKNTRFWRRILAMGIATLVLATFGSNIIAQDDAAEEAETEEVVAEEGAAEEAAVEEEAAAEEGPVPVMSDVTDALQVSIDTTWIIVAGILVFFMQAGFAMLEAGMIRQTGVVNSLMENFMDAALGGVIFWMVGYAIAYGNSIGGFIGASNFFLGEMVSFVDGEAVYAIGGLPMSVDWFFQFAFAATAGTIATGAMAERTSYIGKMIYTIIAIAIIYPVVVHWTWGGGWLAQLGFADFAGSTIVHAVGGVLALTGALVLGPRPGREWGNPPRPHNLALATLGALVLWVGWYGFNPGSTLGMGDPGLTGLVTINTTVAASAGALMTMYFVYFRSGKWSLPMMLNGALAGLVGITAGCAFVTPFSSFIIGLVAGVLVVITIDIVEASKIDDAVGAFAVHGACGMMGTLAIGFLGQAELGAGGLLTGNGIDQLIAQIIGVVAVTIWVAVTGFIMFSVIKGIGVLRIPAHAETMGIDVHEHDASVWPDVKPVDGEVPTEAAGAK